ncbi:MAG TPA: head-tail connector protein [Hyphomicrobiales bacterium]|nr:head-tail connector protein [Hyphomicrobiales bacterium]
MPLILTSGPAAEPVSLSEAKAHCRIDTDAEDTLISSLILAARLHIEQKLDLALVSQNWSLYLDAWPDGAHVELPLAPLINVQSIRTYNAADEATIVDPENYSIDTASRRPRVAFNSGISRPIPGRPVNGIEIAFTAGYGAAADDVPMPIRQALKMLVAHWYEAREPVVIEQHAESVPSTVASLIAPYRSARL